MTEGNSYRKPRVFMSCQSGDSITLMCYILCVIDKSSMQMYHPLDISQMTFKMA